MLQNDSTNCETSSSEYESSEADEDAPSLSSISVVKSDLFVTGGSSLCYLAESRPKLLQTHVAVHLSGKHRMWQLYGCVVA